MRLRVDLRVVLEVDEEILEENTEPMTDAQIANLVYAQVAQGSFLSSVEEAVEISECRVAGFFRLFG